MVSKVLITTDLQLTTGISILRIGNVLTKEQKDLVIGTQDGHLKILSWNQESQQWIIQREFDLTENGAIWYLELADLNADSLDEMIIGGMAGAVICLSGEGEEIWVQRCSAAISGIKIWPETNIEDQDGSESFPRVIILSLDRTLRVFDHTGQMLWAQMFSGGVGCVAYGDCDNDGSVEIVAGGNDGTLRVFESSQGQLKWFKDLQKNVRCVVVANNQIITGGDNNKITIFDGVSQEIITEKAFATYIWHIRQNPWNSEEILIGTFSFAFLGAEDENMGSPSIGFYSLPNLEPRWEKLGMNVQDVSFINATSSENLINQCIICGDTDQFLTLFSIASGDCPFPTEEDKLPSLINSVSWVSLNADSSESILIVAGCDDGKLYTLLIQ